MLSPPPCPRVVLRGQPATSLRRKLPPFEAPAPGSPGETLSSPLGTCRSCGGCAAPRAAAVCSALAGWAAPGSALAGLAAPGSALTGSAALRWVLTGSAVPRWVAARVSGPDPDSAVTGLVPGGVPAAGCSRAAPESAAAGSALAGLAAACGRLSSSDSPRLRFVSGRHFPFLLAKVGVRLLSSRAGLSPARFVFRKTLTLRPYFRV